MAVYRDGHYGAALLAYAPVGNALRAADAAALAALGTAVVLALARAPDCDRRLPFVDHRGPTHSVLFAALVGVTAGSAAAWTGAHVGAGTIAAVGVGSGSLASLSRYVAVVATLSVLSHLAADALTPAGVALLWPVSDDRISLGVVRADSAAANYALLVTGVLSTLAWAHPVIGRP